MSRQRTGILLVNLGTPAAPSPEAVRAYLRPFLSDKRVVDYPRWLWYPILYGMILPLRSRKVANNYQAVWTEQGSPLRTNTLQLAEKLRLALAEQALSEPAAGSETLHKETAGEEIPVAVGMTYGEPSLSQAARELTDQGCQQLLVLPLFPQYSSTTTAAVFDGMHQVYASSRFVPAMRMVNGYYQQPAYLQALADSVRASWQQQGRGEHLLLSFHGIPERYVREGDPYQQQCEQTARRLAEALQLSDEQWTLCYQSRVGKEPWLGPDTESCLRQLAQRGVKRVDVLSPAFATDCLETLDELAVEGAELFKASGGEVLTYVPALNDSDAHVQLLLDVIRDHGQGWLSVTTHTPAAHTRGEVAG